MTTARRISLGIAVSVLGWTASGLAWDSQNEARTRAFPRQASTADWFPGTSSQPGARRRFLMEFLKDAMGPSDGIETSVTKFLKCQTVSQGPPDAMHQCDVATLADLERTNMQWLRPRQMGDDPHGSEHTLIAREAARRAGLLRDEVFDRGPTIFEPFWLRYPAHNAFVGSVISGDCDDTTSVSDTCYLFGQSFRPVDLGDAAASFVARSVSLLELAQLPDFSNNLSDWALGNETCPIPGTAQAYKNVDAVEACHTFTNVMGAVNATHFKPLNREMWTYYHELAKEKMAECQQMAPIGPLYYDRWDERWIEHQVTSSDNTEVHECERLAMAHEMFAQHFIQDAWAVGHMWMRWGSPRFTEFDTDVDLIPNEARPDFPAQNEQPRRALIAAMVGGVSGMIHGAKSLLLDELRENSADYPAFLQTSRLIDDPLSSGKYGLFPVQWRDVAGGVYRGAGDLFWDPALITGAVVRTQEPFEEQRDRMLDCAAASMLEVYRWAGPRAHGEEQPEQPSLVNPASEHCWGQWTTNSSMAGALGGIDISYIQGPAPDAPPTDIDLAAFAHPWLLNRMNTMLLDGGKGMLNFPTEPVDQISDPQTRALAEDREVIFRRIAAQMARDIGHIRAVYLDNAEEAGDGVHSARQESIRNDAGPGTVLFLGTAPSIEFTGDPPPWPRRVDYVDGLGPGIVPGSDQALSRMFWRGDLQRTCELPSETLHTLKSRCVQAAPFGGDPESCTACVALAEIHFPTCNPEGPSSPILPSKCGLLGVVSPGLPSWWFANHSRSFSWENLPEPFNENAQAACAPSSHMALEWCTDAPNEEGTNAAARTAKLVDPVRTHSINCGTDPVYGTIYGGPVHWRERHAKLLMESSPTRRAWLYPMATAYDYDVDWTPSAPCDVLGEVRTTRDGVVEESVFPADPDEYVQLRYPGAEVPRCGVAQRLFYWNRSCVDVQDVMGIELFDVAAGGSLAGAADGAQCYARTRREFWDCPPGFECTAGGECVVGGAGPSFEFIRNTWP